MCNLQCKHQYCSNSVQFYKLHLWSTLKNSTFYGGKFNNCQISLKSATKVLQPHSQIAWQCFNATLDAPKDEKASLWPITNMSAKTDFLKELFSLWELNLAWIYMSGFGTFCCVQFYLSEFDMLWQPLFPSRHFKWFFFCFENQQKDLNEGSSVFGRPSWWPTSGITARKMSLLMNAVMCTGCESWDAPLSWPFYTNRHYVRTLSLLHAPCAWIPVPVLLVFHVFQSAGF